MISSLRGLWLSALIRDTCPGILVTIYYILDKEEEQEEEGEGEQRCLGRVACVVLFPH